MQGSSQLKRHLKHYHSAEEEARRATFKFECPECHKKIRTKNLLDCHLKVCGCINIRIWLTIFNVALHWAFLKCPTNLCFYKGVHNSEGRTVSCAFCDYTVPRRRRGDIVRKHIRSNHPEQIDIIKRFDERRELWKRDMNMRAKIQCLLCNYAGVKVG